MNQTARYIFIALGVLLVGYVLWYFKSIVAYLLISMALSLMGKPIVDLLTRLHLGRFTLPRWLCALITLGVLWVVFFSFFRIFIPLVANQASNLSNIDPGSLIHAIREPIARVQGFIDKFNLPNGNELNLEGYINERVTNLINFAAVSGFISSLAGLLGNVFIAMFSLSFITFFFLKDDRMFEEGILLFIPDRHAEGFRRAMKSVRHLLMRYFIGIVLQVTGIIILVTTGLTIIGLHFRDSLVIALVVGILNVVPYLGPLVGGAIGTLLGAIIHYQLDFYSQLLPLLGWMILVFVAVQIIDNVVFQPFIYSSSVNAHPLEIFLVIMIAASLAGIPGMILAVPGYTVIRVFAGEFLNQFKVVKKITEKMQHQSQGNK